MRFICVDLQLDGHSGGSAAKACHKGGNWEILREQTHVCAEGRMRKPHMVRVCV